MSQAKIHTGTSYKVNQGIVTGADKVTDSHLRKYPDLKAKKGEGIFILNQMELKKLQLTKDEEKDLIRPLFKNSDIRKYSTQMETDEFYLKLDRRNTNIKHCSRSIQNHINRQGFPRN